MNLHNIKKSGLALAAACMLAGSVQAADPVKNAKLTDIVAFVENAANKASQDTITAIKNWFKGVEETEYTAKPSADMTKEIRDANIAALEAVEKALVAPRTAYNVALAEKATADVAKGVADAAKGVADVAKAAADADANATPEAKTAAGDAAQVAGDAAKAAGDAVTTKEAAVKAAGDAVLTVAATEVSLTIAKGTTIKVAADKLSKEFVAAITTENAAEAKHVVKNNVDREANKVEAAKIRVILASEKDTDFQKAVKANTGLNYLAEGFLNKFVRLSKQGVVYVAFPAELLKSWSKFKDMEEGTAKTATYWAVNVAAYAAYATLGYLGYEQMEQADRDAIEAELQNDPELIAQVSEDLKAAWDTAATDEDKAAVVVRAAAALSQNRGFTDKFLRLVNGGTVIAA